MPSDWCFLISKSSRFLVVDVTTQPLGSILEAKPLHQGQKTRILGRGSQSCSHLYSTLPVPSQLTMSANKRSCSPSGSQSKRCRLTERLCLADRIDRSGSFSECPCQFFFCHSLSCWVADFSNRCSQCTRADRLCEDAFPSDESLEGTAGFPVVWRFVAETFHKCAMLQSLFHENFQDYHDPTYRIRFRCLLRWRSQAPPVCSVNVHYLLHLPAYIRDCGPARYWWQFPMERFCGRVGGYRVALQIADREEPVVTPARRQPRWSS